MSGDRAKFAQAGTSELPRTVYPTRLRRSMVCVPKCSAGWAQSGSGLQAFETSVSLLENLTTNVANSPASAGPETVGLAQQ
jgi:hypothetical protein